MSEIVLTKLRRLKSYMWQKTEDIICLSADNCLTSYQRKGHGEATFFPSRWDHMVVSLMLLLILYKDLSLWIEE